MATFLCEWEMSTREVMQVCMHVCMYGTALGSPTPPPRGWSWFPAPPPVGVGGVVVDGWECGLMES